MTQHPKKDGGAAPLSLEELEELRRVNKPYHLPENERKQWALYVPKNWKGNPIKRLIASVQAGIESAVRRGFAKRDWVDCPICGEPDMARETDNEGHSLNYCVNHACPSNADPSPPVSTDVKDTVANSVSRRAALNCEPSGHESVKTALSHSPSDPVGASQEGVMHERMVAGVRWAIKWLNRRAEEMNDGHAVQILHSAATNLGWDLARARKSNTPNETSEDPSPDQVDVLVRRARVEADAMQVATLGEQIGDTLHAENWADKPHRVLHDAIKLVRELAQALKTISEENKSWERCHEVSCEQFDRRTDERDKLLAENASLKEEIDRFKRERVDKAEAWDRNNKKNDEIKALKEKMGRLDQMYEGIVAERDALKEVNEDLRKKNKSLKARAALSEGEG